MPKRIQINCLPASWRKDLKEGHCSMTYAITLTGKSGKRYGIVAELTQEEAVALEAEGIDICELITQYEIADEAIPMFREMMEGV